MRLEPAVLVSAIAACIAAISALVAVWNYRRELLNQRISAAKWKKEYFADLLRWSDEAMLLLSESLHLCDLDAERMRADEFFDARHLLRVKLSAQIDRGRWFFPNYVGGEHTVYKHEAYRGWRPAVLDALVLVYDAVSSISEVEASQNRIHRAVIEDAKRSFTSEIQNVLNPRSRDEEFKRLLTNASGS